MALLRSAATVGGYTMLSRVLGFVRDILIAAFLGAGPVADAFVVAFRFPNLFRRLVAEGAFAAAFVPLFSRSLEQDGREAARGFAEQALAVLLWSLLSFTILVEIAMPWVMRTIAFGFADDADKLALAVEFGRLTFPYLLFMALVALLSGVLNALYRFAAAAAAPVLLNVILIGALWGFHDAGPTPGHALSWGVTAAGMGQLVWLVLACRRAGMSLRLPRPRLTPGVRRLFTLMIPAGLTAGAMQINILIGTMIATMQPSAVSWLYYADRIYQLPLGVVGIAIGTALLPNLSRALRGGRTGDAAQAQARAIEYALLLTLPAAAALMILPGTIVAVLFERGAFSAADGLATARALFAFALGLPAFVLAKVLVPGFFAREDTRTPFYVTLASVATNVVLSLVLFRSIGHVGIALATTAAAWLQAGLLWIILHRRGFLDPDARLRARLPRQLAASLLMAAALWGLDGALAGWLAGPVAERIGALVLIVGAGIAVFALAAHITGAAHFGDLRADLRRRE